MTISYPLTDFLTAVDFAAEGYQFSLVRRQEQSRQASGVTIVKDLGSPLWTMQATTRPLPIDEALDFEALLDSLGNGMNSFRGFDLRRRMPRAHADGAFADTAIVSQVSGSTLSLSGLGAGFTLSRGDYFSFLVGGRMMLHQALETVTAGNDGRTPLFGISPFVWPSASAGAAVLLKNPYLIMSIVPGSVAKEQVNGIHTAISFQAYQAIT